MKLTYHVSRVVYSQPSAPSAIVIRAVRAADLDHVIVRKFV